ncbi:unnamed protein product [Somion occarium]|uniref:Uncharacterized protein n=1 Tax=Somion occarium TaxID=3059160 RepID=A0ABP1CT41_9APHY
MSSNSVGPSNQKEVAHRCSRCLRSIYVTTMRRHYESSKEIPRLGVTRMKRAQADVGYATSWTKCMLLRDDIYLPVKNVYDCFSNLHRKNSSTHLICT